METHHKRNLENTEQSVERMIQPKLKQDAEVNTIIKMKDLEILTSVKAHTNSTLVALERLIDDNASEMFRKENHPLSPLQNIRAKKQIGTILSFS